jgi:hypothetical protein
MSEIVPTFEIPEEMGVYYDAVPHQEIARVLRDYWNDHEEDGSAEGAALAVHEYRLALAQRQLENAPAVREWVRRMSEGHRCAACGGFRFGFGLCQPCQRVADYLAAREDTERQGLVAQYLQRNAGNGSADREVNR